MVVKTVIWTDTAVRERRKILKYWTKWNKSSTYSEKLIFEILTRVQFLLKNPENFISTDYKDIRTSTLLIKPDRFLKPVGFVIKGLSEILFLSPNFNHTPILRKQFRVLEFGIIIHSASHKMFGFYVLKDERFDGFSCS